MPVPHTPTPEDISWQDSLKHMSQSKLDDALCDAVNDGSLWRVKETLAAGANASCNQGQPIRKAAVSGRIGIAIALADAGAKLKVNDEEPMCWAARDGNAALVEFFLSRGSDEKSYGGRRAQSWAEDYKQKNCLHLLEHAAEVRAHKSKTGKGQTEQIAADLERGIAPPIADIRRGDTLSDICLAVMADAGKLDMAFEAKLWVGDIPGMKQLWDRLPPKHREEIDIDEKIAGVKQHILKSAKIPKLKL